MEEKVAKKKNSSNSTFVGFLWMATSSSTQAILRFLFMLILARLLTPADFGVITVATMVTGVAELFIEIGIGPALVQTRILTDKHISTGFTYGILSGLVVALILYLVNPFIASFFRMPSLLWVLNLLIWMFPIRMITKVSYSLLQKAMQFKKLAGNEVVSYVIAFGFVGIPLAYMGYGFKALVFANILETAIYSAILFYHQPHKLKLGIDRKILKELLGYGTNSTISTIFSYFASQGDYFVVGRMANATALGLYSRAYKLMDMSNTAIGSIMNKVLFPSFARIAKEERDATPILKKSFELVFIFFMPAAFISSILSPEIIHFLLGRKWDEVIPIFQILSLGMIFRISTKVSSSYSKGSGLIKKNAFAQVFYFLSVVVGAYIGLFWNLTMVAFFITIALFINFFMLTQLVVKNSNYSWKILCADFLRHLIINIPSTIIIYLWAVFARNHKLPAFEIIIVGGAIWIAIVLIILKINSQFLLGANTKWIKKNAVKIPVVKYIF